VSKGLQGERWGFKIGFWEPNWIKKHHGQEFKILLLTDVEGGHRKVLEEGIVTGLDTNFIGESSVSCKLFSTE
jgi:hypothetical protein